ncbi:protein kinase [Salinibacterium sp. ZJ450]|uniref:protein kinase domain-containing protein n=1 Tax=Salinibacterium sp. ZJ450 TaxID=2708338 RepID=UPI00141D754A|nr:protein kinase [Salinibacterium sp. ZJ450]
MSLEGDARPDELLSGRYRLGDLLGSGGTASVFRAHDTLTGDTVAVKVLHPRLSHDEPAREAFFAEAMAVAGLAHPNIVRVHAVGVHDAGGVELAWIAEDLAAGVSLSEHLEQVHGVSIPQALVIAEGVLWALTVAHESGLVHRDLSPGNVMVDVEPDGAITVDGVRLVDFGLADAAGRTALGSNPLRVPGDTAGELIIGNAHYLSPEQARGEPVDERGDVYQAGAVLYTLLTGQVPYPRSSIDETVRAHASAPPPVPSATRDGVPREVDRIVVKAMATAVRERYQHSSAMLEAVRAAQARYPMAAGAEPAPATAGALASAEPTMTRVLPVATLGDSPLPSEARTVVLSALPPASDDTIPVDPMFSTGRLSPADSGDTTAARRPGPLVPYRPSWGAIAGAAGAIAIIGLLSWGVIAYQLGQDAPPAIADPGPEPTAETSAPPVTSLPTRSPAPTSTATAEPEPVLTPIPDVAGLTLAVATRLLGESGFTRGQVIPRDSIELRDVVLGSEPAPGTSLAPGSGVNLVVASGNNLVPAVAGMSYQQAVQALRAAGFAASPTSVSDVPSGATITGTSPASGASLPLGNAVSITFTVPTPSPTPTAPPTEPPVPPEEPE